MPSIREQRTVIGILALTQVISWGAIYYAFAILGPEIQREMGWRPELVFGAFSWSLLVAGAVSTPAGAMLDRHGGRAVMGTGSLIAGTGLLLLGLARSIPFYFAAWTILGVAMALVLYEAAFATINREFTVNTRKGISTLTLFGGFASTVFWPITLYLNAHAGWRDTYLIYGAAQLAICLPAHLLLRARPPGPPSPAHDHNAVNFTLKEALRHPAFWKLAFAFATNAFIFSALSVHLIPIMHRLGHPMVSVVFFAALIGPLQVIGRIGEMAFAHRTRPRSVGMLTFAILPAALIALLVFGEFRWALLLFCVLYGLSNGILTIVRGTIPRELFGHENYGAISGALAGPSLVAKAAGPLGIATAVSMGVSVTWLLAMLAAVALCSFVCYVAAARSANPAPSANQPLFKNGLS